jgi:hypothetical protein
MNVIKRKILLDNYVDRTHNSPNWGVLTATSFNINVSLNSDIEDIGFFEPIEFAPESNITPDYTILVNKLTDLGVNFPFMNNIIQPPIVINQDDEYSIRIVGKGVSDYYTDNTLLDRVSGYTESRLDELTTYDLTQIYKTNLNIENETYINYLNQSIISVNKVVDLGEPIVYVFDAVDNADIGTINQTNGLLFMDYSGETRFVSVENQEETIIPTTEFSFVYEGLNETNLVLSAITKIDYMLGIVDKPKVNNDVFIDRGINSVLDKHIKLSEINNLKELINYNNKMFNIRTT